MTALERFELRIEISLLLVQHTEEEHNCPPQIYGKTDGVRYKLDHTGFDKPYATRGNFPASPVRFHGSIKKAAPYLMAAQSTRLTEFAQFAPRIYVEELIEFINVVAHLTRRLECYRGLNQRPGFREPAPSVGPEPALVEFGKVCHGAMATTKDIAGNAIGLSSRRSQGDIHLCEGCAWREAKEWRSLTHEDQAGAVWKEHFAEWHPLFCSNSWVYCKAGIYGLATSTTPMAGRKFRTP